MLEACNYFVERGCFEEKLFGKMPVWGRLAGKVGELMHGVGDAVGLSLLIEKNLNVIMGEGVEDWSDKLTSLAEFIKEKKLSSQVML